MTTDLTIKYRYFALDIQFMQSIRLFGYSFSGFQVFLSVWTLVALLQSYFMDLSGEEAYYVLFARSIDFGYLDHPPMVAFATFLGELVFQNELGARLLFVAMSTCSLYLMYELVERKNLKLFVFLSMGLLAVHAGSFLIKTDVPLLFGELLFFYFYKLYLEKPSLKYCVGLSIAIAFMFLSKYHGVLIVLFTLFSNPRLFTQKPFYKVLFLTVILMLPYAFWQYENDWMSLKFHLSDRSDISFKWSNVLGYLFSQPIVLGPLVSIPMFIAVGKRRGLSMYEKALKYVLIGVLVFFFFQSFRVFIHKHWTSIALVPLFLLSYSYLAEREKLQKTTILLGKITLIAIVPVRFYFAFDILPKQFVDSSGPLHHWERWSEQLDSLSSGRPIVFVNSYENASRYQYYAAKKAHTLSTFYFNNTQFDYWDYEENIQGREVFLINHKRNNPYFSAPFDADNRSQIRYAIVPNYRSYARVDIELRNSSENNTYVFDLGETKMVDATITNKGNYPLVIDDSVDMPVVLSQYFLKGEQQFGSKVILDSLFLASGESKKVQLALSAPDTPGNYQMRLGISYGWIPATINSSRQKLKVKE